jgi:sugar lactone lactonase YvrE
LSVTHQVQIVTATSPAGTAVDTVSFNGGYAVALTSTGKAYLGGPFGTGLVSINLQSLQSTAVNGAAAAYAIAVSGNQQKAYLTTGDGAKLREIDLATGTFTEISVGAQSYGLALSPDGRLAYVGTNAGKLVVVDLNARAVIGQVSTTTGGLHVTVDGNGRYAYISWGSHVEEIDLTSKQSVRTFNVPASHATALSYDGRTLYVGTEANAVYRVDLVTGTSSVFLATPSCSSWGLGITPDDRFLYLGCSSSSRIEVVDVQARQIVRSYTGFVEPRRVAVSADGSIVVVAAANVLAIFR